MQINDLELTAIYAALVHSTEVCNIYWEQDEDLKKAAGKILDRITDLMEERGLLAQ